MDLMDDELRRVLSGSVDAPTDSMARELARLRVRDRGPTATERAAASQPSFRMPSSGRRRPEQRGGGEALEALGSTILGSVPAGLAGAAVLPFQGPEGAAKTIGRVQDYLTIDPQTEGGDKALLGILKALSPLGAPAQAAGDVTLRATGSPLLATGAELLADPLNLLGIGATAKPVARAAAAGARQAGKAGKATGQSLGPKAAEMAEAYMRRSGMAPSITEGVGYATRQEGPFYRVAPSDPELARFAHRGTREASGESAEASPRGIGGQFPQPVSDESIRQTLADPSNFVMQAANRYAMDKSGQSYTLPIIPESSLVKQSPIGRVFQLGATDDPAYKSAVFESYGRQFPKLIEQAGAKNYDQLVDAAYRQFAKEAKQQFESLPVNMSFHRAGEGNYLSSGDMLKDVYGNRHLYVFQGGEPHPFLNEIDPVTGLNSNEMFRAVHDFYGHAIHGNQFGPKGEEIAYAAHGQMFSPLARLAMATETRGQNSVVNYTPLNAALKARISKLDEIEYEAKRRKDVATVRDVQAAKKDAWNSFQFAPQKGLLLPPEFVDVQFSGGMPDYIQPLIRPGAGTTAGSELVHFSNAPGLTQTDPRRYGQGIKGEEAERLSYAPGAVKERTYFYAGEPGAVTPEPGLGPYRYRARSGQLYDVSADPLELRTLAAESSRTPFSAKYNPGIQNPEQAITDVERMVKEYGYEGMVNPKLSKPTAIMYGPTAVQPFADGGAVGGNNMSYTTAADTIADKLMRQGMDPDQAFMTALRMSDARMKAGGAVLMADGGDAQGEVERQYRMRRSAEQSLFKPEPVRMRKTWDGPMPNRPVVNGKVMVSAEELADFRRRFGEKMTLRDLLNADKGRGPSAAMPAARGAQGANVAPVQADPYQDPSRALEGAAAAQRAIAQPGRDAIEGVYPEAALLPASRLPQAARAVSRALATPKLREHPSISVENRQRLKEMEDYISGLNQADRPAVDSKIRALEQRREPRMQVGGAAKRLTAGAAARAEARLAEKAAKEAAQKALAAAPPTSLTQAIEQANKTLAEGRSRPYAKPDTVRRMIIEEAVDIAKSAPKLKEEDVASRAQRQVLQRLKWERETRPELQSQYGELAPSSYDMSAPRRMRNTPEVVAQRAENARAFLAKPTEPWAPPPQEKQAFERSLIKDALEGFPGIEQTRFPRYESPRANVDYINEIYDDPKNRSLIKQQITRGLPLGGESFYGSLYPVKVAALERGIPAEKFDQFIYQTAPASARNSIMNEMAVGQFMRDMKARGLPLDEATVTAEMAKFKEKYGIGLPLMPIHRQGVQNVIEGGLNMRDMVKADIPTNYKIPTYGTQKAGDFGKSVVLDVHEAAGETQGSRYHPYFTEQGGFGPTEYGLAESKMLDIAKEMGIPGGMAQAGRWFGGGELTGLKSPRGDALDLLEKQAAYTMQGMGINPTPKAVRDYILNMIETGEGVLMPWFKGSPMPDVRTVKKEGGEVTSEAHGALSAAKKSRKGRGALV
jgi:hypothetical protein